jgi:transposase InsO family protein
MAETNYQERCRVIHLLRSGSTAEQVAEGMSRSVAWVYKWQARYERGGWEALKEQSRAPKHPQRLPEDVKQMIRATRSELEAEAQEPDELGYIGAQAIRSRLYRRKVKPLPSISSIERELRAAGMVRPRKPVEPAKIEYPHVKPTRPHQLVQVDIVPHYLPGGQAISCFNALDVVSRYPTGQPSLNKRSEDAAQFLLQVWQELGIPTYTQLDNEGCFSGGSTHPYVLGRVLRLGLWVGTQLIYSPIRHPESNAYVERFHQDYNKHLWDKLDLPDFATVLSHSPAFFAAYRASEHHSALMGQSPATLHHARPARPLPLGLRLPTQLPLTAGKAHFIRRVDQQRSIRLLNVDWDVSRAQPDQGVWATLEFSPRRTTLAVFDAAPGFAHRRCLVLHTFPLQEPVLPLQDCFRSPLGTQFSLRGLATRSLQWLSTML